MRIRRLRAAALALAGAVCLCGAARAEEFPSWYAGKLEASAGVDFRTGDYGRAGGDTEILYLPFALRYRFTELGIGEHDEVRVKVTVPYLNVSGPERGSASVGASGTDSGIGDVIVKGSYLHVPRGRWLPVAEVAGTVKIPSASRSRNLGTGEFDFGGDLTLARRFALPDNPVAVAVTPFASIGYKIVGDPPGSPRNDSLRASAGATLRVNRPLRTGFRYSYRESTLRGLGDTHELSPFFTWEVGENLRVTPYGVIGLSQRSPDGGGGLVLTVTALELD